MWLNARWLPVTRCLLHFCHIVQQLRLTGSLLKPRSPGHALRSGIPPCQYSPPGPENVLLTLGATSSRLSVAAARLTELD